MSSDTPKWDAMEASVCGGTLRGTDEMFSADEDYYQKSKKLGHDLERENAALTAELAESARLHAMGSEREARLTARVAELERDAGRYRWLREQNWTQRGLFVVSANNQDVVRLGANCPSGELLDEAIDNAARGQG